MNLDLDFSSNQFKPLAAALRPSTLEEYSGQKHILGEGTPLHTAIKAGHAHSLILWGPPGTGKTTLAELIAKYSNAEIERLSAVTSGVKEIREAIAKAQTNQQMLNRQTVLFVDEVHRFNKSQQDGFLPYIEDGTIIFIGATTENPSFELNSAVLSRARVYVLKSLTPEDLQPVLVRAFDFLKQNRATQVQMSNDDQVLLCELAQGDARRLLNLLELAVDLAQRTDNKVLIDKAVLQQVAPANIAQYDKNGDKFYDLISAFHKSVRGSSPDAALYWYARILAGGGDPLYVARRLLAIATEDIGNADPRAMTIGLNAWDIYHRVGAKEGERAIAQAAIYMASAAKSNAVYMAFSQAKQDAQKHNYEVPNHLRNAPTKLMSELGFGAEYRYAHDEVNAFAAGENYFPPEISNTQYYYPSDRGLEKQIKEKLAYLTSLNLQSTKQRYD
ncbi:replication-associated recombination protein A [Flocculibacter collagenilyticus]|uniref:replication-associated recombination protein A n=1 Tax=Flocculibacter collagenilyticus TaxID=2744479 RepID=UPI0018F583AA|nr:replication-associated recombination protein A [Flocculibacter collagenilyticus]